MRAPGFATPELASSAFYRAFETGDLDSMMAIWSPDEDIQCVHPAGPVLRGTSAIRASWAAIFSVQLPRQFEIEPVARHAGETLVILIVHEIIRLPQHRQRLPALVATNAFSRGADGWRMVLHHASAADTGRSRAPVGAAPTETRH